MSKLTTEILEELVSLISEGVSQREITKITGIPKSTVGDFSRKETYKDFWEEYQESECQPQTIAVEQVYYETGNGNNVFNIQTSLTSKEDCTHLMIPDTQVKPGISLEYLRWAGEYIVDRKPDVHYPHRRSCRYAFPIKL